jgi:hypothetical protein
MKSLNQAEIFSGILEEYSLLNSKLVSLQIEHTGERLLAKIRLRLSNSCGAKLITLVFKDVREYSFLYSVDYSFYNVENYKFSVFEKGVYISLDPADDQIERSQDDQDYIVADQLDGFIEE